MNDMQYKIHCSCIKNGLFKRVSAPRYIAFLSNIRENMVLKDIFDLVYEYGDAQTVKYLSNHPGILSV